MPNQLAQSKKRKTIAEHAAVLALLDCIAEALGTTSTELLRIAARDVVKQYAADGLHKKGLGKVFQAYEPKLSRTAKSAKEISRYKRESREYDALALDLGFKKVEDVQASNSIHRRSKAPVLVGRL